MKTLFLNFFKIVLLLVGIVSFVSVNIVSCNKSEDDDDDCDDSTVVYKPNIYLYPKETTQISVTLNFPLGGQVIASEPLYDDGWDVTIEPSGRIDNTYDFLFYESTQPNVWQVNRGWVVAKNELESFFDNNLSAYKFNEAEIDDFITYWVPRLVDYQYYCIYPQTNELINTVIELSISGSPDHINRLFYYIRGTNSMPNAMPTEPQIENLSRDGFSVMEWGVIL